MKSVALLVLVAIGIDLCAAVAPFNVTCKKYTGDDVPLALINNKYILYTSAVSWHGAYESCQYYKMQLATVSSAAENAEIAQIIRAGGYSNAWISGNDYETRNSYKWMSTGKPLTYTNWKSGEPSHSSRDDCAEEEHCIEYEGQQWNDCCCAYKRVFVCERKTVPEPANSQLCITT